ncbi:BlaI/MecI/CopY family transcriptional regulator [Nemorincola caseinilytica]|uniref:BlaI/MecI/CopY family transcriptional regulator n=1 Tax=Nemorincola caseinilytica TaxID=2054315 RepID=A0ABP8N6D0_9BACT
MSETPKPTESELEILNILWERGPSTVRDVHEVLEQSKEAGYTTTLKLMQIMHDKKLLARDTGSKSHVYTANISQEKTQGQLVKKLIDSMFNGSASQLVMQALGNHKTNKKELDQIKKYLEEIEKKSK